ncbi:NACHT domain-containing protein [Kineosporia sp. J2-2]|uniref:NACHT domain-containing protein n=1 Tax=Kineosporia corallincola TaxID=2835133 RepID=A0ABS5TI36_9ACTN|nr:NACHT domain-containing protein [Kineosporia corallincola]MBT0770751.1 NACHT domain-containing protein [Kineosporia corallincola]
MAGGIALICAGLFGGMDAATALVGLFGAVLEVAALLVPRLHPPRTAQNVLDGIRADALAIWQVRAEQENLYPARGFTAIRLRARSAAAVGHASGSPHIVLTAEQFEQEWATFFREGLPRRAVIHGRRGAGKTTVATLAGLGLLKQGQLPVPILLDLGYWNPGSQEFTDWMADSIDISYPATRAIPRRRGMSRLDQLLSGGEVMLILDGLDEVRAEDPVTLLPELLASIPHRCRTVVTVRTNGSVPDERAALDRSVGQYVIDDLDREQVHTYVSAPLPRNSSGLVQNLGQWLRGEPDEAPRDLISTPEQLREAISAVDTGLIAPQELEQLRDPALRERLARREARSLIAKHEYLGRIDTEKYLTLLARKIEDDAPFLWWRLSSLVPAPVYTGAASLVAVPGYLLAHFMPVGLTRGLVLGLLAGIYSGVLRGVRLTGGALLSAVAVVAVGVGGTAMTLHPWQQALADTTEITSTAALLLGLRPWLVGKKRWKTAAAVAGIGAGTASATEMVCRAISFDDPYRDFTSILVSGSLGAAVATVAASLLLPSGQVLRPSSVQLKRGPRKGWIPGLYISGLVSAMAVGLAGGLGGALRFDPAYGVTLGLLFGVVVGVPVGIVGGVIRRLAAPLKNGSGSTRTATLSADRQTAAWIIASIAATATTATILLNRFAPDLASTINDYDQPRVFVLHPLIGLFFGALIGLVVAGFNSAWPSFAIGHLWLVATGQMPWRLEYFLTQLTSVGILRRQGFGHRFQHPTYRQALIWDEEHSS